MIVRKPTKYENHIRSQFVEYQKLINCLRSLRNDLSEGVITSELKNEANRNSSSHLNILNNWIYLSKQDIKLPFDSGIKP